MRSFVPFLVAVLRRILELVSVVVGAVPLFMVLPVPPFMLPAGEAVFALPDESVVMLPGAAGCR